MASIGPVSAVSRFHNSACRAAASSGTISPASQSALSRRPFETGVSSLSMQSIAVVLVVVLTGASLPSLWMNYLHNRVNARSISLDDRQATVQAVAGDLPLPSGGELFPKGWEDQAAGKLLDYATSAGDEYKPSPGCQSLVPRIFYQSGKEAESDLDAHRKEWRNSWKKQLQSWQFLYWEDSGNREFIETYYPWFLERYDGFARGVMRADALRVFFLYHHGGVYADLDFQCLRDISPLLCDSDVVLGRLPHAHAPWSEHMIPNAIMASAPRQQLWVVAMYLLMTFSTDHVESATGPVMINTAIQQYSDVMLDFKASKFFEEIGPKLGDELQPVEEPTRLVVMPGEFLYPVDWTGGDMQDLTFARIGSNETAKNKLVFESNHTAMFPNSYAVTWWTHSWGR